MSGLPSLNIIVAVAEGRRLYAALESGVAGGAGGRAGRLFLQREAGAQSLSTPTRRWTEG